MAVELPTISVVTPSFNQARFLERTIRSVLEQGYPRLEYIVMDGGSSDGSVEIVERYAARLSYWASGPDGGQTAAINSGWRRASGEIVAWLNSDDFYLPGTLLEIGHAFATDREASLIYGLTQRVDADGNPMGTVGSEFRWRTLLYSHQVIPQPSAFFRRSAVDAVGPLDESLHYSMDYDFFLRLTRHGPARMLSLPLAGATIHEDAKTTRDRARAAAETHRVRKRYARGLGAVMVRMQPSLSWAFHRMPAPARAMLNRLRPRRVYEDVVAPVRSTDSPAP
ncbi:MAG: glycosyltransferase [Chloroflexota bacterium]|nr:glycosyltransferase [Chloroflexota bacterium]